MKGIIFTEQNTLLTVKGLKTMTRRIVPEKVMDKYFDYDDWCLSVGKPEGVSCTRLYERDFLPRYSRYKVGETVYLKEPYIITGQAHEYEYLHENKTDIACIKANGGYKNKLFMPESAARYFIKITGVRAEKLHDITEDECLLEGIKTGRCGNESKWMKAFYVEGDNQPYITAKTAYGVLIDKINGKGTWDSNPFVWVYDYELTKQF